MVARAIGAAALALGAALAAPGAEAFDCAKASTPSEKAICADPTARAADSALSAAYSALWSGADAKQKGQIAGSQIAWLKYRDNACADSTGPALSACLARETSVRAAFLSGRPEAGPGPAGRLAPTFWFEKGGKGRAAIDFDLLVFADPQSPAEKAFNAAAQKLKADVEQPEKGDPAADRYAFETRLRVLFASPALISARADAYFDTGGAHPNSSTVHINVDMASGKPLTFADAFDAKAAAKVVELCGQQVLAAKKTRDATPTSAEDLQDFQKSLVEATGDLSAWGFTDAGATIVYGPYAVGSFAEGEYQCILDASTLKRLVKSSFPLP